MIANLLGFSHLTIRTVPTGTGNSGVKSATPENAELSKVLHSETKVHSVTYDIFNISIMS